MRKVKRKDYENITDANVRKVIGLLNDTSPITKKEACEILNISYNTTRLQNIINEYEDKVAYRELRKKQNRGKAATDAEISEAVELFLSGDSIATIAKRLYRSPGFVKGIIERVGVPQKQEGAVDYLPDECCAETFAEGEVVWSARYHGPAIVRNELSIDYQAEKSGFMDVNYEKKYGSKCYAIYVLEEVNEEAEKWALVNTGGFDAYSLAYDLGKLTHLEKYGVDLSRI